MRDNFAKTCSFVPTIFMRDNILFTFFASFFIPFVYVRFLWEWSLFIPRCEVCQCGLLAIAVFVYGCALTSTIHQHGDFQMAHNSRVHYTPGKYVPYVSIQRMEEAFVWWYM